MSELAKRIPNKQGSFILEILKKLIGKDANDTEMQLWSIFVKIN